MDFKCECGSESYSLFRGASQNYISIDPEQVNIDIATVWWAAVCEHCDKRWGIYSSVVILKEAMVEAGVLK